MDGMNGNELVRTYYWGLDLSGTLQGAGGVGGLLMIRDHTSGGEIDYYTQYDGNGNVLGLIDDNGAIAASYEYDPFGNLIRIDGPYAEANPFRLSTKYTDTETGLVYYGHRYYSPSLARFLNRDPIEEAGGLNLYAFVGNDPVNRWDVLGLAPIVRPRVDGPTADRLPRGQTIHFSTRSRSILADRMAYGEDDDPLDPTNYDPRYGIAYGDPDYTIKVAAIERAWAAGNSEGSGSDTNARSPFQENGFNDDCKRLREQLEFRINFWYAQNDRFSGSSRTTRSNYESPATLSGAASALGSTVGLGSYLAEHAGISGKALPFVGSGLFATVYGDSVGTAVGEGLYGTGPSYTRSLGEVLLTS